MPWEIATYLLGAQGGVEDDFARLYAATNPVLMRYLRVTTDADPAALSDLALGAWTAALPQLMACPPDEDAWLELIIGSARAAAAGSLRTDTGSTAPETASTTGDDVDHAIETLRACPPEQAEVLAMGLVANLDRDATSRLTDHEPTDVLALVQSSEQRLTMSLGELTEALRAPGRDGEVADVRLVTPLITAALAGPAPTAKGPAHAAPPTTIVTAGAVGAAIGAEAGPAVGAVEQLPLAELLGLEAAATGSPPAISLAAVGSVTGALSRPARVGVGVGVWGLAVGGVGMAAAMSGLITVAIDGLFGDHGGGPLVTAEGPARPGSPSSDGDTTGNPPVVPGRPGTDEPPATGGGRTPQTVTLPGRSKGTEIVLASFVPQGSTPSTPTEVPTTPTTPSTPTTPPTTPPSTPPSTPPVVPPPSGPGVSGGNGHGNGHASARETRRAIRQARVSARANDKAVKAAAKVAARADSNANDKGRGKGKALGHGKATSKGKALGHDKPKANGKAAGHNKS